LDEAYRLRVIYRMVLRKVFGPNKEELREGWRKFHNEELRALKFPPKYSGNKARWMRWTEHVLRTKKEKFGRRILVRRAAEFISCLPTTRPNVSFSDKVHVIIRNHRTKYFSNWSPHHCAVWLMDTSVPQLRRPVEQFTFASRDIHFFFQFKGKCLFSK
jgi:hypothetical protein